MQQVQWMHGIAASVLGSLLLLGAGCDDDDVLQPLATVTAVATSTETPHLPTVTQTPVPPTPTEPAPSPTATPDPLAMTCIDSGGEVSAGLCCLSTGDFPDTCAIGPCGCSPEESHEVRICDCGEGGCFDGARCISRAEAQCIASGGTVATAFCCLSSGDFPDTCAIGACGCAPAESHEVQICQCGADRCFDGVECVEEPEPSAL